MLSDWFPETTRRLSPFDTNLIFSLLFQGCNMPAGCLPERPSGEYFAVSRLAQPFHRIDWCDLDLPSIGLPVTVSVESITSHRNSIDMTLDTVGHWTCPLCGSMKRIYSELPICSYAQSHSPSSFFLLNVCFNSLLAVHNLAWSVCKCFACMNRPFDMVYAGWDTKKWPWMWVLDSSIRHLVNQQSTRKLPVYPDDVFCFVLFFLSLPLHVSVPALSIFDHHMPQYIIPFTLLVLTFLPKKQNKIWTVSKSYAPSGVIEWVSEWTMWFHLCTKRRINTPVHLLTMDVHQSILCLLMSLYYLPLSGGSIWQ